MIVLPDLKNPVIFIIAPDHIEEKIGKWCKPFLKRLVLPAIIFSVGKKQLILRSKACTLFSRNGFLILLKYNPSKDDVVHELEECVNLFDSEEIIMKKTRLHLKREKYGKGHTR